MAGGKKMGKILEKLDEVSEQIFRNAVMGKEEQPTKKNEIHNYVLSSVYPNAEMQQKAEKDMK